MRRLAILLALLPAAALAQTDSDGDSVPNALELNGYRFDVSSGEFVACTPGPVGCYVTDPLSWSSDGDPYGDGQEASGVNMDATVAVPYNSPLVAAYPVIEVALASYSFNADITITDAAGRELTSQSTISHSVETTAEVSVTVGTEAEWPGGVSASAEATASYSETRGYTAEQTSGQALNWETATTVETGDAGTLTLSLVARNTGGATALNVRPRFSVAIGGDVLATVTPDEPFRQSLAPGEASPAVVPEVGGEPLSLTLTFDQLVALQTGAAVTIEVVDVLADIQRWRPQDSNWECGSGDTCSWTSFQNQILPRTLRLLVDFGYTGDPDAQVPSRFRGSPYEFRVYTGSPNSNPEFTLRDVLRLVDFELEPDGGQLLIEGRPYPAQWVLTAQADADGYSPILDAWDDAGQPDDLLGLVMPTQATLLMASPDPLDPGPVVTGAALTKDLLDLRISANGTGSIPIVSAEARIDQYGATRTVPLARDGLAWSLPDEVVPAVPIGAARTTVTFTDRFGTVTTVEAGDLGLPVLPVASCPDVPEADRRPNEVLSYAPLSVTGFDAVVFPDGDTATPVEVFCGQGSPLTRAWVPKETGETLNGLYGAVWVDEHVAVVVGNLTVLRSTDGGRSWTNIPVDGLTTTLRDVARRPDTGTLVAVGGGNGANVILRSEDDGLSWVSAPPSTTRTFSGVAHAGGDTWFAVGQDRIMVSTNDGKSWGGIADDPGVTGSRVSVAFRDAQTGIVLDTGTSTAGTGRTWRTTDGGVTWTNVFTATGVTDVAYAGDDTWYLTQRTPGGSVNVLRSRENGAGGTWSVLPLPDIARPRSVAFSSRDVGFVASDEGISRTDDGGATWTFEPRTDADDRARAVALYGENRGLVTGIYGIVKLTTSGGGHPTLRPVASEPGAEPPPEPPHLDAPYPNPFRNRATVTYALTAPGPVSLTVHDVLGRRVAQLAEGEQTSGSHTVTFDGHGLAAGVYVVRLMAGDRAAARRVTLVR